MPVSAPLSLALVAPCRSPLSPRAETAGCPGFRPCGPRPCPGPRVHLAVPCLLCSGVPQPSWFFLDLDQGRPGELQDAHGWGSCVSCWGGRAETGEVLLFEQPQSHRSVPQAAPPASFVAKSECWPGEAACPLCTACGAGLPTSVTHKAPESAPCWWRSGPRPSERGDGAP